MAAREPDRPRVRVAALITHKGGIVTVRHRAGSATYHLLPGGGVGYRETLESALRREVLEETGLEVAVGDLLFVNDTIDPHGSRHVVNLTFLATITGGAITDDPQDPRVEAVDVIAPAQVASLDLRPPLAEAITRLLQADPSHWRAQYLGSLFADGP